MKKLLIYFTLIACVGISCKKQDRTTIVFGKVTNEINQPIADVEMVLYGEKGILGSVSAPLKSVFTDNKGEYMVTLEIPKEYHSGEVLPFWTSSKMPLYEKYEGISDVFLNGQQSQGCCSVPVGQKSQYDFRLVRKK